MIKNVNHVIYVDFNWFYYVHGIFIILIFINTFKVYIKI